jgi:hypothetical protein
MINFPNAIPEEVFVYFGNQENSDKASYKEMILNFHFMHKQMKVL